MDLTGYSSNVLGALTVAGIAGIAYCVKNKLKHSECDFNTKCLKIRSHEDSETRNTIRREVLDELRRDGLLVERRRSGERTPSPKRSLDIEEGEIPPIPPIPPAVPSPFRLSEKLRGDLAFPPKKRQRTGNRL